MSSSPPFASNALPTLNLSHEKHLLLGILNEVKDAQPFQMVAYVILDNHFHLLIKPAKGQSISKIIQSVKLRFTYRYKKQNGIEANKVIWQKRFWDHIIRDEDDLKHHLDYIHFNPIKHGLVNSVKNYPYSSFKEYINRGHYDLNWGLSNQPDHLHAMDYE